MADIRQSVMPFVTTISLMRAYHSSSHLLMFQSVYTIFLRVEKQRRLWFHFLFALTLVKWFNHPQAQTPPHHQLHFSPTIQPTKHLLRRQGSRNCLLPSYILVKTKNLKTRSYFFIVCLAFFFLISPLRNVTFLAITHFHRFIGDLFCLSVWFFVHSVQYVLFSPEHFFFNI